MRITVPELSLVVLIGASGSGKSTFARKHFKPTEILSSDYFRALVSDDENDQSVNAPAFELLHQTCAQRLALGKLTVIDATNVQPDSRKSLLDLARRYHVLPVAVVLDIPAAQCEEWDRLRTNRHVGARVIRNHHQQLGRSLRRLGDEGFRAVHVLTTVAEMNDAVVERELLRSNRKSELGPFDIIGDVHGCIEELKELLEKLGYTVSPAGAIPASGRKALFLGDLVDRGPDTPGVLELVMDMVAAGNALCVRGNHDDKLLRKLKGRAVSVTHGLEASLKQLESRPPEFIDRARAFLDGLATHFILDGGRLVIAHAGLKEKLQGRISDRVRAFALFGETTGETDEFGLPVRLNWAAEYRGKATVVFGHTPTLHPEWINRTICIDTGCVYGGALSALRYPERELVQVPARRQYAEPKRPLRAALSDAVVPAATGQQAADELLDVADVIGKRIVATRWLSHIPIREGNAVAALEVMSRFAVNPRWLIYLPPTMSPCHTSKEPGCLEHPREAFDYFARESVAKVVCEQKHMGSRAVVVICRDEETAHKRFGVAGEGIGVCLTRTGRRFFDDPAIESAFLGRLHAALGKANFWERFQSNWFCIDGELMPWSVKAQELLRRQYAATGSAGRFALQEALAAFPRGDGAQITALRQRFEERASAVSKFIDAYRGYCWPVHSVADLRFAPFHLLAAEGRVFLDLDHAGQMTLLAELAGTEEIVLATPFRVVELSDPASVAAATDWWEELTNTGGEGMVVKPLDWINRGRRGLVQPAMKVRGREYLRIIYGPEYLLPENLDRLRMRGLGLKQSLALREFSLGLEALERFVAKEPLRRVHECVFGVLALESEPVDTRL